MLPVSGLASWVVVCGGSLMCLSILGINVQPLLTVGGVSTVLVGLSAQSVLANLISGINLVSHMHHAGSVSGAAPLCPLTTPT